MNKCGKVHGLGSFMIFQRKERMEEIGMTIVLVTILQMISVSLEECNVLRHLSTAPKGLARNRHSLHG